MRIALAQINPTVGDLKGNSLKIADYINKARNQQADLVVFPELALCGYPPEDLLYKEHFIRDNLKALEKLAKEARGIAVIVGFVDRNKKGQLYNAAALIIDGKVKDIYHKQALPNYGVFDEKRYFASGHESNIFVLDGTKLGVNICEDIWVDDGIYKTQVKKGARLLINISSSPYDLDKVEIRQKLLKRRAIETKCHIIYVNLVGGQDELVFDGHSMVLDAKGRIVARAEGFKEDLLVFDVKEKNRVIEPKNQLEQIYNALILGTRDYLRKNGFQKAVVGLSGGIDSAVVAAIAVEAIGKENVIGVSMPSRFSSAGTREDAQNTAKNLGITFKEISIEEAYKAYLTTLQKEFAGHASNIAEENVQARIRGNILMALSNKFGWIVLTTGNKSEIAVGYCTLYGDMSGGFAVIKDVPKTMIYQLAQLINKKNSGRIPESTIKRAPTAELRENQKDQDTLPPYDVLDRILEGYIEKHESFERLAKKNDPEIVKRVIKMVDGNEYKRRQGAPGVKITSRAFGKDWRLPITNKYKEF